MSTYRKIHGRSIQAVTTDPTESVAEGQVWYNTNSNTFKSVIASEAFSSGSNMNNARRYFSGFGTQTAAVAHGGSPALSTVEHYNGSGWSNATAMPATYSGQGASGTQTSGLVFGGSGGPSNPGIKSDTFEYNGSSWTSGGAMVVARSTNQGRSSAGTQTAALGFGGYAPGGARSETEEYDGNSWTAGGALPAARNHGGGSGTQTSALAFGGLSPGLVSTSLAYDGSSWTSAPSLVYAVLASGSAGTSTSSIAMGGSLTVPLNTTNKAQGYDGTSWSEKATLATARRYLSGVGTGTAALASGGSTGSDTTATEEFTSSANVITAGAYSSGPTLDTNRRRGAGWGSMTSAVLAGGQNPGGLTSSSSEFDGSSWTAGGTMNSARQELGALGATESAGLVFGGEPNPLGTAVEYYNGSSWTNGTSFPTAMKFGRMHAGPNTAGIVSGGSTPTGSGGDDSNGNFHDSHDWNGSSWTANTDMPFANQGGSAGSQTATVQTGNGYLVSPTIRMLDWNGSSWTAGASAVAGTDAYLVVGTQAAFVMGTANPPKTLTQVGDGTTIATGPSFAVDKSSKSGIGSSSSLNGAGGGEPGPVDTFEEFTGETTALNVKTLTQS